MKRRREIANGALLAGLGVWAMARSQASAHRSRSFGSAVSQGPGQRRALALTFDDGPSPGTPALLDYLAAEGIHATFFQCGLNVTRHRAIAARVHAEGHEIGNHTYDHQRIPPRLSRKPNLRAPWMIHRDLAKTQDILAGITGAPPRLFRPPYGERWFGLGRAQERLGLQGVLWTVIGHDWEWPADRVSAYVLERASPGGIICLHDGRDVQEGADTSDMLVALKSIVPVLRARGYSFETVSQLLQPDALEPKTLEPGSHEADALQPAMPHPLHRQYASLGSEQHSLHP